jgi:hypothetical protein
MAPTTAPMRGAVLWHVRRAKKFVLTLRGIADNVSGP